MLCSPLGPEKPILGAPCGAVAVILVGITVASGCPPLPRVEGFVVSGQLVKLDEMVVVVFVIFICCVVLLRVVTVVEANTTSRYQHATVSNTSAQSFTCLSFRAVSIDCRK